ncbi:MAG TPA: ShlB/FhaC/HecB family hemolysin secretion/activation protein [Pseudomonadales bacterium]
MTLMKLAPESVRLRRIARAHAAGEMSEAQYRAIRREVIDSFPATAPPDDDTRRRDADEVTLRGAYATGEGEDAGGALDSGARRWFWFAALGLLLAAAAAAVPEALAGDGGATQIPPVRERVPDPTSSPRVAVERVHVTWAGDPEQLPDGLLETLQQRADAALADIRARNTPGSHGFTDSELQEIGRFLEVLGVHRNGGTLDAADARDLGALIREQKQRRGVSVAELEEVAAAVEQSARAEGWFLAAAYLPAQPVRDGAARIEVLPGVLGDVVVEGGDARSVTSAFAPLLGRPVTLTEVSSRLQALNALPGVTAQASFVPGAQVGESRLRLNLLEQRAWVASVSLDDHGDDATGEQRLGVTAAWLNPRALGDRLSVGAITTADPSNQTYGYVDYDTPLGADYRLSVRLGNNDFRYDGPIELDGEGWFVDVAARRSLSYSRERGLTLVAEASRQSLEWYDGIDQTVTLFGIGLAGHRVLERARIAADGAISLSAGHISGDRFAGQEDDFWLLEMDHEAWTPMHLPGLDGEQKLLLRLAGQWSDSLLPATRRFALGGPYRARGFDRGTFLGDRGVLLGLEVRQPIRLGELVLFTDLAYGDGRADDAHTWARLSDAGLGWHAELVPGLSSRLSWAVPLSTRGTGGIDDDGSRIYWSLRYAR